MSAAEFGICFSNASLEFMVFEPNNLAQTPLLRSSMFAPYRKAVLALFPHLTGKKSMEATAEQISPEDHEEDNPQRS